MANRLAGNTIIVDSAAGNVPIVNTISNSAGQMTKFRVNGVAFWTSDTAGAGRMIMTEIDTTNHIVSFGWLGASVTGPATQTTSFGMPQLFENIKIPVLTAGTAWIYLC